MGAHITSTVVVVAVAAVLAVDPTTAMLDNGVALTPPLGWLSWQRYRCHRNCTVDPDNCFSENLVKAMADKMVSEGYKDAGYEYVNLDDCWQAEQRVDGRVVADPERFPSGIKALAAYVHSKGLKLGLYTALGNGTCAMGHFNGNLGLGCDFNVIPNCTVAKQDIEQYVSWDIDHLKVDGCAGFDRVNQNKSYAIVGQYLLDAAKKRGSPVVYHPSNLGFRYPRQFHELLGIANQWRWFNDVQDSWESVYGIIEEIGAGQPTCIPGDLPPKCTDFDGGSSEATYCSSYCSEVEKFVSIPRPGGWHDPDMLLVGNTPCSNISKKYMHCNNLTHAEEQTQMAIWSLASAPLFMSNDLRVIPEASKEILLNKEVLKVNQDPLGRMCRRFMRVGSKQGWKKDLANGDVAVALVNMDDSDMQTISLDIRDVGFAYDTPIKIRDLFAKADVQLTSLGTYSALIPPHGVKLLRISYVFTI